DVDANELALVYRARGMDVDEAALHAQSVLSTLYLDAPEAPAEVDPDEAVGSPWHAAGSSFLFFSSGAVIAVLPYLFGLEGLPAVILGAALVGLALLATGAVVGILSGTSPL